MMTSIKDIETLELLVQKLKSSVHNYICVRCGYMMNITLMECPKCHSKDE